MMGYAVEKYRELGVVAMAGTADEDGGAVWAKVGADFDLYEIDEPDEARKRARAVARIFAPDAERRRRWRRVPKIKGPNPYRVLRARRWRGGASARAAREMQQRIPTEKQIDSGDLDGTFTSPAEIVAFEAQGIRIGEEAMLRAKWDGIKYFQ